MAGKRVCAPPAGTCEACNGLDDDGDGSADEGTLIDIGSCLVDNTLENAAQNRCNVGAERCVDGQVVCFADSFAQCEDEWNPDGIDDDCDGVIDEAPASLWSRVQSDQRLSGSIALQPQ